MLAESSILSTKTEGMFGSRKMSNFLSTSPPANKILKLTERFVETSLPSSSVLLAGLQTKGRKARSLARTDSRISARPDQTTLDNKSESVEKLIFKDKTFALEFSSKCGFKDKQRAKGDIKKYGGTICHILNKKVTAVIAWDDSCKDAYKCRRAAELSVPVLSYDYITDSILDGKAKDVDAYMILGVKRVQQLESGKISGKSKGSGARSFIRASVDWRRFESLPPNSARYIVDGDRYSVPKWAFLISRSDRQKMCVIEVHVLTTESEKKEFRVMTVIYQRDYMVTQEVREADSALQAELLFSSLYSHYENNLQFSKLDKIPPQKGSTKLQQTLFSWTIDEMKLSANVSNFIDMVWDEAVGELEKNLTVSVDSISSASVEQAEAVLLEMKAHLASGESVQELCNEFYSILPYRTQTPIRSLKDITRHLDIVQLLYDLLSVGEATDWKLKATTKNKLKLLNCHISQSRLDLGDESWGAQLLEHLESDDDLQLESVFEISRPAESLRRNGKATRMLFHASRPENYLGILSRGLLLPKHVVNDIGGKRTDAGNLGQGIYFADNFRTSHDYTTSFATNSRLMLVCEVVVGTSFVTTSKMPDLVEPPAGYDSVMAQGQTASKPSQFQSNEHCVYNTNHQVLRYVIRYTTAKDRGRCVHLPPTISVNSDEEPEAIEVKEDINSNAITDDISDRTDVLADVLPGLQVEGSDEDKPIPLKSIHVMASLVDVAAEVTVLQEYLNTSTEPIEAKFVFPLSDMAAVCGFEAYINDKHIIGTVKEKETAQREYRKAVSEGHGAYLMVQDKERPDVFTVSVGNLPPSAKVLIKIIYVCELSVQDEKFLFELPTNLAPWNARQALAEKTQNTVDKVDVDSQALGDIQCSLQVVVQMPFDIREIECPTHKIVKKTTATQAVIRMQQGQSLDNGFQLTVSLAEIHVPRMIIENHPDDPESKQACMLTFYPEFDCDTQDCYEMIILLDLSNSMSSEDLLSAKKIALVLLTSLNKRVLFNVITFGSTYSELFPKSMPATGTNVKRAIGDIRAGGSRQGNTNLLTPLTNLSMLSDTSRHRNVVVISDGYMTTPNLTLQAVSGMYGTIRLFTLAVSLNANKYLMRELARVGSGVSEYMNPKSKSKWSKQISGVLAKAGEPLLSQVEVVWQEQNTDLPTPLQAPACIPSVFNGNRIVVYGFASNCFMARLKALIDGREVSTVVSASPLMANTGLTVHRLAARSVIQDWEHGCLSSDTIEHTSQKKKLKSSIIEMSKEYSIITQFTSFVAVEDRKKDEFNAHTLPTGPSIGELVSKHMIDPLSYMMFEEDSYATAPKREVIVQTLTGKTIRLMMTSDITVRDLKEHVYRKEGIPPSQIRLICDGQNMEEESTLQDFKLFDTKLTPLVHMVLRLRGSNVSPDELSDSQGRDLEDADMFDMMPQVSASTCSYTADGLGVELGGEMSVDGIELTEEEDSDYEAYEALGFSGGVSADVEESKSKSKKNKGICSFGERNAVRVDEESSDDAMELYDETGEECYEFYDDVCYDDAKMERYEEFDDMTLYKGEMERYEEPEQEADHAHEEQAMPLSVLDRCTERSEKLDDRICDTNLRANSSLKPPSWGGPLLMGMHIAAAGALPPPPEPALPPASLPPPPAGALPPPPAAMLLPAAAPPLQKLSMAVPAAPVPLPRRQVALPRSQVAATQPLAATQSLAATQPLAATPELLTRQVHMKFKKKFIPHLTSSAPPPSQSIISSISTDLAASPIYSPTSPSYSPASASYSAQPKPPLPPKRYSHMPRIAPADKAARPLPGDYIQHKLTMTVPGTGRAAARDEIVSDSMEDQSLLQESFSVQKRSQSDVAADVAAELRGKSSGIGPPPHSSSSSWSSTSAFTSAALPLSHHFESGSTAVPPSQRFGLATPLSNRSGFGLSAPAPQDSGFGFSAPAPQGFSALASQGFSAPAPRISGFGSSASTPHGGLFGSFTPQTSHSSTFGFSAPASRSSLFGSSAPAPPSSGFDSSVAAPHRSKTPPLPAQSTRRSTEKTVSSSTAFSAASCSGFHLQLEDADIASPPEDMEAQTTSPPLEIDRYSENMSLAPAKLLVRDSLRRDKGKKMETVESSEISLDLCHDGSLPPPLPSRSAARSMRSLDLCHDGLLPPSLPTRHAARSMRSLNLCHDGSVPPSLPVKLASRARQAHIVPQTLRMKRMALRESPVGTSVNHQSMSSISVTKKAMSTLSSSRETDKEDERTLPGVFSVETGGEQHLVFDYRALADFRWNPDIHVIFNTEWMDMSRAPARICYSEGGKQEIITRLQELISHRVQGFDYRSLELILVNAGLLSMGKTAAEEVFCLFLWKIIIFLNSIELPMKSYIDELKRDANSAVRPSVKLLVDSYSLSSKSCENFNFPFSIMTKSLSYAALVKKYPMILTTLELGKSWCNVLINMFCDRDNHQLKVMAFL